MSLLPGEWDHSMPVTHMQSKQQLTKGLLTAALFGRVYDLDDTQPTPTVESSAPRVAGQVILTAILAMTAYNYKFAI